MQRFPKRVSKSQRFLILSEHFQGGLSISELSRKYQVHAAGIYQWRGEQMRREEKSAGLCPKELLSEIERLKKAVAGLPEKTEACLHKVRNFFQEQLTDSFKAVKFQTESVQVGASSQ